MPEIEMLRVADIKFDLQFYDVFVEAQVRFEDEENLPKMYNHAGVVIRVRLAKYNQTIPELHNLALTKAKATLEMLLSSDSIWPSQ